MSCANCHDIGLDCPVFDRRSADIWFGLVIVLDKYLVPIVLGIIANILYSLLTKKTTERKDISEDKDYFGHILAKDYPLYQRVIELEKLREQISQKRFDLEQKKVHETTSLHKEYIDNQINEVNMELKELEQEINKLREQLFNQGSENSMKIMDRTISTVHLHLCLPQDSSHINEPSSFSHINYSGNPQHLIMLLDEEKEKYGTKNKN